jgi:hypothetical protein
VALKVDEDSCVAAVERRGRRARDVSARLLRRRDELVDFGRGSHVVSERDPRETSRVTIFNAAVQGELVAVHSTSASPPAWKKTVS